MELKHIIAIIVGIAVILVAFSSFTNFFTGKAVSKTITISPNNPAPGETITITINPNAKEGIANELYIFYDKDTEEIQKERIEALCGIETCKEEITKEFTIPTDWVPGNYLIRIHDNKKDKDISIPFTVKEQFCADSDGGIDYYTYGEVRISHASGFKFKDSCKYDSSTEKFSISEKYCEDLALKTTIFECPSTCNDGACQKPA